MRRCRALLLRRAIADHRLAGDEPRFAAVEPGARDGGGNGGGVVSIHISGIPASRLEAPDLILGGRERGRSVDRNSVVVEQHDQPAQPEMTRQRDRLLADALHEAAVAGDHIGVVVDNVGPEPRVPDPLSHGHADSRCKPLPQRPRRGLYSGRVPVLGMPRRLRAELPEPLDLIDAHPRIAGQIEQRVEQHRAVAGRQHEAVAVVPVGIGSVEAQELSKEHSCHVCHAHRHAWMPRFRLLDRVHRKRANGIGHIFVAHVGAGCSR